MIPCLQIDAWALAAVEQMKAGTYRPPSIFTCATATGDGSRQSDRTSGRQGPCRRRGCGAGRGAGSGP